MIKPALVSLVLALAACSSDPAANDASSCDTLTLSYDNFGAAFMTSFCNDCHSASLSGGQRQAAPTGIDFDTHEDVLARLERIRARTIEGTMPPFRFPERPSEEQLADVALWIDCGAP